MKADRKWPVKKLTAACGDVDTLVGTEVPTAVTISSTVFWDVTPCSQVEVHGRFGRTYFLHLQGRRISRLSNQ
jgi:hypothetical protein